MGLTDGIALGLGFALGAIVGVIILVGVTALGARILAGRDE